MKITFHLIIALIIILNTNALFADITIQEVVEEGREGDFNCSFKGKQATKKCHITNSNEIVTNKDLVSFYGEPGKSNHVEMQVLNILWPDKTRSRFAWGDSMEISNLQTKNGNGYKLKFAEWPDIDYSNGLVILDENDKEYIRLW